MGNEPFLDSYQIKALDPDSYKQDSQSAITCSKFTIETLEQDVKYVQS